MRKRSKIKDKEYINSEKTTKKKKTKKRRFLRKLFIFVLILFAISGVIFAKRVYDLNGNWLAVLFGHNKNTLGNLSKLYILAMGESTGLSDTIIVCSYDPKAQEASMLSIPRDTFVGKNKNRASTLDKINSLYNDGKNPERTINAVNELTGLEIQNYILIDTNALIELVDIIGGIEFNVPRDMKYDDYKQDLHINLHKGWQKLNGNQVEQLVRFRHNNDGSTYSYEYGMEDLGRMKTQREVIKIVAAQMIKLKNVKEVGRIIDISEKYVQTNMNFKVFKDYVPYAFKMNIDNIKTEQLPGIPKYLNGISFFLADTEETNKIVDKLFLNNIVTSEEKIVE